jgi:hypothetical protein
MMHLKLLENRDKPNLKPTEDRNNLNQCQDQ